MCLHAYKCISRVVYAFDLERFVIASGFWVEGWGLGVCIASCSRLGPRATCDSMWVEKCGFRVEGQGCIVRVVHAIDSAPLSTALWVSGEEFIVFLCFINPRG